VVDGVKGIKKVKVSRRHRHDNFCDPIALMR